MKAFLKILFLAIGLLSVTVSAASATVTITFYHHKFRLLHGLMTEYPHGFVTLTGTTSDGTAIDTSYGFSATSLYLIALLAPLNGDVDDPYDKDYIAAAIPHFAFPLTDAQYQAVLATVDKWRKAPQPSYDFYTANCVSFVSDLAVAAGLAIISGDEFIHDPQGFLNDTASRNRSFLVQYGNRFRDSPAAPATASLPQPATALPQ